MSRSSPSSDTPETDLAALARAVVPMLLQELTRLAALAALPSTYSTRRGCGPAGVPDREWKRIARRIGRLPHPGARWHVVSREDYERWRDGQSVPAAPVANDSEPWSYEQSVADAGCRLPRSAR